MVKVKQILMPGASMQFLKEVAIVAPVTFGAATFLAHAASSFIPGTPGATVREGLKEDLRNASLRIMDAERLVTNNLGRHFSLGQSSQGQPSRVQATIYPAPPAAKAYYWSGLHFLLQPDERHQRMEGLLATDASQQSSISQPAGLSRSASPVPVGRVAALMRGERRR